VRREARHHCLEIATGDRLLQTPHRSDGPTILDCHRFLSSARSPRL
jgi:hypothetical protein